MNRPLEYAERGSVVRRRERWQRLVMWLAGLSGLAWLGADEIGSIRARLIMLCVGLAWTVAIWTAKRKVR